MDFTNYLKNHPDQNGRFGKYGGAYLPEKLIPAFKEINEAYQTICHSSQFISELRRIRKEFQGRPTPVYHCQRLSRAIGNCQIYLKREDLNHSGAHKLNHCMELLTSVKIVGGTKYPCRGSAGTPPVSIRAPSAIPFSIHSLILLNCPREATGPTFTAGSAGSPTVYSAARRSMLKQ